MFPNHTSYTNSQERYSHLYQHDDQAFLDQDHLFDTYTEKEDSEQPETFYFILEEEADHTSFPADSDDKIEEADELFNAADDTDAEYDVDDSIALYL
jgi:hypothetical protein